MHPPCWGRFRLETLGVLSIPCVQVESQKCPNLSVNYSKGGLY